MREDREWDYKQTIGFNPLPGDDDPEFHGEVPNDAKGYAAYRRKAESTIQQYLGLEDIGMRISFNCEGKSPNGQPLRLPGQSKEHTGCSPVCACNHVIHHDPENPAHVHFVPVSKESVLGYYLCDICYRSMRNHRLNIGKEVCMKCSRCVLEALMKMEEKRPGRIVNHLSD